MSKRRFAVLGLGQFGSALAGELSRLGCEVLAVDVDPARVEAIRDDVASAATADISDPEALKELFSRPFDAVVIATGGALEAAIIATLHIRDLGVGEIWAEANSPDRAEVLRRVGATHILQPELDMGQRLAKRLAHPNMLEYLPIQEGYAVAELDAPEWTHGKTLAELDLRRKESLAVISIRSVGDETTVVPGGDTKIRPGDVLTLVGQDGNLEAFQASK
jgi:trk system potassium uptake protein TrkA